MKPGITGLAQVSGRKGIPWAKRIEIDIWYVDHWSLWLDFKILLRTVRVALFRKEGLHCGENIREFRTAETGTGTKETTHPKETAQS